MGGRGRVAGPALCNRMNTDARSRRTEAIRPHANISWDPPSLVPDPAFQSLPPSLAGDPVGLPEQLPGVALSLRFALPLKLPRHPLKLLGELLGRREALSPRIVALSRSLPRASVLPLPLTATVSEGEDTFLLARSPQRGTGAAPGRRGASAPPPTARPRPRATAAWPRP